MSCRQRINLAFYLAYLVGLSAIKADLLTQDALIRRGPWFRTPYIGQHGWVSAHTSGKLNWTEIEDLVYGTMAKRFPLELTDGEETRPVA